MGQEDADGHFWEKWYFPANAVLYIVGDLSNSVAGDREPDREGLRQCAGWQRAGFPAAPPNMPCRMAMAPSHSSSSNGA